MKGIEIDLKRRELDLKQKTLEYKMKESTLRKEIVNGNHQGIICHFY